MAHARLQGSESESGGMIQHARLQGSESESDGVEQHACHMPDFKEVSVMER